jgi:hypothetical protein
MIDKIEKLARDLRADYGFMADKALDKIRTTTLDTADLVAKTKQPVRKIADTGIKLNRISHKGFEKLVKAQARFFEATIDDGAKRLEMAARADGFRALFGDQIATFPASRERTLANARKSIDVVRDTGDEISDVLKGTIGELQATMVAGANAARTLVKKQAAEAESAVRTAVAETEKAISRQAGRIKISAAELEVTAKKTAATTKGLGTRKVTEAEKEVKKAATQVKRAARKAARPAGGKKAKTKRAAGTTAKRKKAVSKRRPVKKATAKKTVRKSAPKKAAATKRTPPKVEKASATTNA